MAGRPRQRALIAELERRTRATFEDETSSHADYIVEWTESGRTLTELVLELTRDCKQGEMTIGMLRRYLMSVCPTLDERLAKARAAGAHAKIEDAQQIIEDASTSSREALTKAKMQADVRLWHAERYNKAELGRSPDVSVVINHNTLHLDAMRQRVVSRIVDTPLLAEPAKETATELEAHVPARLIGVSEGHTSGVGVIGNDIGEWLVQGNLFDDNDLAE